MATQIAKAQRLRALHEQGTFILPNFWDVGSARVLERLGFQALASTSAGFAQTIGKLDSTVTLEEKLMHLTQVCTATDVPVSADFEHGFANAPRQCAENLLRVAEAGAVGASIEDWSRTELYDINHATDRIAACVEALASLDYPFALTARTEVLLRRTGDLDEAITRLQAYDAAGADVLYAPGLSSTEQIQTLKESVTKPINVLVAFMPDLTFRAYDELGVRRISLGSTLANRALGAVLQASNQMLEQGDFMWSMDAAPGNVINSLLAPN